MRLIYLATLTSAAEIAMQMVSRENLGIWFPVCLLVVNVGAALARIIDQPTLNNSKE